MRTVLLIMTLMVSAGVATAQFSLTQVSFPGGSTLDVSGYPKVKARLRATNDGQPVSLAKDQLFILQNNIVVPVDAVAEETQGVHVVEWTTSQFDSIQVQVLGYHQGRTARSGYILKLSKLKGGRVVVRDSASRNVPYFVDFGTVAAGASDTIKLKVVATEVPKIGDDEVRISLDAITVSDPRFKVIWKGTYGSAPPPVSIASPLQYRIDLVCEPTDDQPLNGVLTVTFEGGMRTDIMISANPTTYPRETVLNVVSPNGGESFAPCQEIPIRWRGMVSGFRAFVEYSRDNGRSWEFIDSTLDSSLTWKVPVDITDSARIRVSQKFQSSAKKWLEGEDSPVTSAAYSLDGRYLLVGYGNGSIHEWDVAAFSRVGSYSTGLGTSRPILALGYIGSTRNFVAALASQGGGGTLQRFDQGSGTPVNSAAIPSDIFTREIGSTQDGSLVYILPQLGGRLIRFEPAGLVEQPAVILDAPISTASMNGNTITAALTTGDVVLVDGSTGVELDRSKTPLIEARGPIVHRTAGSANNRLVALAGKQLTDILNAPKEQRTFIYDMQTDRIVKILFREGSDAVNLSFSPSNAFLALGFEFNPQFVVYDLMQAKTLPPEGSAEGHSNRLTDLAFSPDGSTVISTSVDRSNNALIRRVSSPETDMSDGVFRIAPAQLATNTITLSPLLIGTSVDTVIGDRVCNTGSVPVIVDDASLVNGTWLKFGRNPAGDTIGLASCLQLEVTASPLDTGLLTDTVVLVVCGAEFRVPVEIRSVDRDLAVLTDIEYFGDVCVGSGRSKQIAMIRNNDSIPVTINAVFVEGGLQAQFRVVGSIEDSVIPPNGTLEVEVEFLPRQLGDDTSNVIIRYAGQRVIARIVRVAGRGSGADVQLSHQALAFIPEIPVRELIIRNGSANDVTIDSAVITAGEPFTVLTPLPVTIGPMDSVVISIRYEGGMVSSATGMDLMIQPCASLNRVRLASYSGTAALSLPNVTADPRSDTTSIPINASITENVAYNGVRFFEGAVTVHPQLFLAREITTSLGSAEILSQDIVDGLRVIRFRIEGSFSGKSEIGRLIGYAGMAEIDESVLSFGTNEVAFGSSVVVTFGTGRLTIVYPDPDHRVVDKSTPAMIRRLSPTPASNDVLLELGSSAGAVTTIRIMDRQGAELLAPIQVVGTGHPLEINIDIAAIPVGVHYLVVETNGNVSHHPLVIVR